MKKIWMILPVVALTLGCSREIDTNVTYIDGEFSLYATSGENDTRTVLQQDGRVFWSPSDCITVFYGNVPGKFTSTNTEPAASAEFTGSLGSFAIDGETEFRAIYPHSNDVVTPTDEGILSIYLPSEQTGVEGTFADDLFICVAKSKDVNLHFYNVCGGVKFSLARGDIQKVVFRGNNRETLAGRMAVEFDSNGIPQVTDMTGGKSSVTLLAPDGGTFKAGSFYYLVLVPQSLTKGYTMELWTDELVETISFEASVTVRRAAWGVLKNLGATSPTVEIPEAIDLGLPSGLKWASFNLGASKPEEYGDYYAWGETELYYSSLDPLTWKEGKGGGYAWSSYKWCMGTSNTMTKYCSNSSYGYNGFTDNKTVLDLEDDAAHVNLGGTWRMPTDAEWTELREKCTWTWTTQNGVRGRLVTGSNGNSIFLPAAGYRYDTDLYDVGSIGYYWSSSLYTDYPYRAWYVSFNSGDVYRYYDYYRRCYGFSVRPVYGDVFSVESVSLDKTELELNVGEITSLFVTIIPENATNKSLSWSSSDESIATVSSDGIVKAVAPGTTVITVTTSDGEKAASCTVYVKEASSSIPVPEIVDLGLPSGLKWASFNIGASKPEEYGDYYAWGEVEPYYSSLNPLTWKEGKEAGYNWPSYKWCMGSNTTLTKYCNQSSCGYNGFTDNKTVLDSEDDAAHVNLGGNWRMPTKAEWGELMENCTWTWTRQNGVRGKLVTAKNGNSIFLPAAALLSWTGFIYEGDGYYWSSSMSSAGQAWIVTYIGYLNSVHLVGNQWCHDGSPIRPVYDDSEPKPENKAPEPVDLGLPSGLKWASFNLGATKPEEYGDYFAWGETEPKADYSWATYKWCMGSKNTLTKYCTRSEYGYNGFTDEKTVLDPEDDAAHVILGGNWRMPTKEEQDELRNKCSWEWTQVNGVNGQMVTGPNGNSIFLPAACDPSLVYPEYVDSYGGYWSCSLYTSDPDFESYQILFFPYGTGWSYNDRFVGFSVRPVSE